MRLAVFTSQFPSRVSTFFARDMRALLAAGIEIDIFPLYPLDARLWRYVPDILSPEVLPRNRVHHINLRDGLGVGRNRPLVKLGTYVRDLLAVGGSAARFGIEAVSKSAYASLKAWVWSQTQKKSFDHILAYWGNYAATSAYHFHRLSDPTVPFSMFLHAGTDLYRKQVYLRRKLLYADNIIVVCEFNRRFIRQLYGPVFASIDPKIQVYHLGLDLSEYSFAPTGRLPARVLGVGDFGKPKGFDYLLRAVHELALRGREVELDLIGDGEEASSLRRLAKELGLSHRVRFRGWRTADEVRVAMTRATVLAHPSTELGDAVPTVIKESMAVGMPVVASDIAGIPELLDGGVCGVLVPPKNVTALADGLEKLLGDETLRRHYAEAARRFAERKFDLWQNGKRLAAVLCSSRRRAA